MAASKGQARQRDDSASCGEVLEGRRGKARGGEKRREEGRGETLSLRARKKRQAILDAAHALFLSEGFPKTNMDAVSARAKVSKATLYSYFPSKTALFAAVLEVTMKQVFSLPERIAELPPKEGLRAVAARLLDLLQNPQAIGLYRAMVSHGRQFPEMVRAYQAVGTQTIIAAIAGYFVEQNRRGTLAVSDPELLARLFFHMARGPLQVCYLTEEHIPCAEIDRTIGEAVHMISRAYVPDAGSALKRAGSGG